ncbi:uncharacterized protein [Musca autumnalis]|uniref:uncharacterized protein n=1 Tax=Musca autumnalis TaxID=221902 RepID=UPI003CF537CB
MRAFVLLCFVATACAQYNYGAGTSGGTPQNNGLEDAVLGLAKKAAEQRTAIYVLNKQPDLAGLADKFNNINNNINHKPEVHFVKYRTAEDAANAQRAIQGQYDSLGGTTQHFNGGVASALNFASQASRGSYTAAGSAPSGQYLAPAAASPSENYLPPSILRRLRHK